MSEQQLDYSLLNRQLDGLLSGEQDLIANLSNASAFINQFLPNINWVGFYLIKNNALKLGPFQGLPACVDIQIGKGVCGTAVAEKQSQLVEDVNQFPGHIACDANSQSEIVIPIYYNKEIIGVLDIDAPVKSRFNQTDLEGLELLVKTLEKHIHL
ncbi:MULTISPECIES: GAF domain-containing protein [Mammaliicoccus]|jgi:GAF domain-containing protein|uniref:GAF domain-containing protein n=1 Tax=Mammaliicoccus sciuri TaxID=1296 RepID=A0AAW5LNT8_MAMSC|nr:MULTISPECIES: GAF domain-containing protein [Mammaliicoccus]MBG9210376.1 GAF domain-containing protein [Mammaliicoccus sciuri]MCD5141572.1 GAF domain-containing protein [Mammaliicoccus sciuri]MCD8881049.1 GAF domain-containing protein [Mammaliicoccus sciuri]MCI8457167.1 GAF domain-containing protein [Mammaliicoccus sciuri]MCJ0934598.1 GAF domain-containing protein [Mammaliicoccus sciuri]